MYHYLLAALLGINTAWAADVAGSADYPDIGRYEGSEITKYQVEDYGSTVLATGPVKSARDAESTSLRLEGRITRIVYRVPKGVSPLEVFRNFEQRIAERGYTTLFSGGPDDIHDYNFKYKHPVEKLESISLSGTLFYLSAKKASEQGLVHLSLLVSPHSGGDGQRVRLIAVESKAMEERMLDAEAMQTAIAETGRATLYGIYFDSGSATIKENSSATLEEIGKLLKKNDQLRLIVVGHTDNQGGYDYNLDLSSRRAESVRRHLVERQGIAANRLKSAGVGYLAPAATNASEAGRALNRRVELVQDK